LKGVSYVVRGQTLLRDISFSLPNEPSITTLIGPNGAGKSTLLSLMAGFLRPTNGTVCFSAKDALGYMPQQWFVHPSLPLTVQDFLNLTPRRFYEGAALLASLYQRKSLGSQPLQGLSSGEQQQVLFAKALMQKPKVLILDEPTRGLDLQHEHLFYDHLRRLKEEGCAVVMASHDLHTVFKESDRIISLNRHICCMGKPEALRDQVFGPASEGALKDLGAYRHHHSGSS